MGSEITRKLASIVRIEEVRDIENADTIQAYRVLGWWCVDKKNAHQAGDLVVYIEVDSWVPHDLAPFLSKGSEPREYNGVKGERLRTIRLRGQVSQGLLLNPTSADQYIEYKAREEEPGVMPTSRVSAFGKEGDDLTEILDIQKWEAPVPAQLQGQAAGMFPTSLIPKTDQERIQNCFGEIQKRAKRFVTEKIWNAETNTLEEHSVDVPADFQEPTYEVSMKLDGSSCTFFRWEGELRVCSRNLEMKINEENKSNTFVAMALKIGDKIPDGFAFQGEIWGESIQGNKEGIRGQKFSVFDIFDIHKHEYLIPSDRQNMCKQLGLEHVPILGENWKSPSSIQEALTLASGPSINAKNREGVVYKCNQDSSFSFKVISNEWLLKYGE
jgi:RNA ligase (TIGR02306 family)